MLFNTRLLSQRIYFIPLAFVSIFFTLFGLQEAFIWENTSFDSSLTIFSCNPTRNSMLRWVWINCPGELIVDRNWICGSCLLWKLKYYLFLGLFIKHKKTFNDITFRCGKVKNSFLHLLHDTGALKREAWCKAISLHLLFLGLFLSCSMQWREEGEEPSIYALLSFPHFPVSGLKSTSPLSSPVMTPSNELAARLVSGCCDQSERNKKQHPFQAIFFLLFDNSQT